MFFDIGWDEIAVIGVVALVVIGPKDLPRALHTAGKWVGKARLLAREFQSSMDEMVRQAELEDLRKQLQEARALNAGTLAQKLEQMTDPDGTMREALTPPSLPDLETDPDPAPTASASAARAEAVAEGERKADPAPPVAATLPEPSAVPSHPAPPSGEPPSPEPSPSELTKA